MKPAYVRGLGLWTPGYESAAAWCRADSDPSIEAPKVSLLSGPLRRRSTGVTRMAIDVFHQATSGAGCDVETIPSVWATVHGEHSTAIRLLEMMKRREGKLSPTHFHNSVHNTPSGYASIATGNCSVSTTLTGGRELVTSGLLESFCQLEDSADDLVLILADEPLLPPFDIGSKSAPIALAFCLSHRREGALACLSNLRRDSVAPLKHNDRFGGLFIAAALPLLERTVLRRPGTVALEFRSEDTGSVSCVDLELVDS
jgi:hypothetical protein